MKKLLVLLLFTFLSIQLYAQVDVTAGMGISFVSQAALKDYINANYGQVNNDKLNTFSSTVEFMGEAVYSINPSFDVGVEYTHAIFSYSTNLGGSVYDLSYNMHKPSVVAYYVMPGKGYKFKIGGGIGPRILSLSEKVYSTVDYTAFGWGLLGRMEGHTALTENLYAFIAGDMRVDMPGDAKDSNDNYFTDGDNENIGLSSLSFGIKLGISYFF